MLFMLTLRLYYVLIHPHLEWQSVSLKTPLGGAQAQDRLYHWTRLSTLLSKTLLFTLSESAVLRLLAISKEEEERESN